MWGEMNRTQITLKGLYMFLQREEKRNLTDVEQQKIGEGVRESQFEDLTLAEYVIAKRNVLPSLPPRL